MSESKKRLISSLIKGGKVNPIDLIKNPSLIPIVEGARRENEIAELRKRLEKLKPYGDEKLLTREETAEILDISLRKLDQLKADGEIAHTKVGRSIKFQKKEIVRFIKRNTDYEDPFKL